MRLFSAYIQRAPNRVFVSIVLGALAGVCYTLLIPLLLSVLRPDDPRFSTVESESEIFFNIEVSHYPLAVVFVVVCGVILLARTLSQILLARVAMDVTAALRIEMYERILKAPILEVESVGSAKLIAALTTDVPRIVSGARMFPDMLMNLVTLTGMLGFLAYLNSDVFWFVIGCIIFGVVTYQVPMMIGRRFIMRARRHIDALQETIRGLIHGIKELKLDRAKRGDYLQRYLVAAERRVVGADKAGQTILRATMNYGNLLLFFVIGAVTFVLVNYHAIGDTELIGVVMALLYVSGPIAMLLNFLPQLAMAHVSINKVNQLFRELPAETAADDGGETTPWHRIELNRVRFAYPNDTRDHKFVLGPVDLEINQGEITFIVGGNGSGKSTLAKLLTLHYLPDAGEIRFGGVPVSDSNLNAYRQQIGAIYADYYLFDSVLGMESEEIKTSVEDHLRSFQLERKIEFRNGRFSTLALSEGQKRRLALIVAMLDDKRLYLFDEWAADQDPTFKEVFYRRIVPELKAGNKAVVIISHDDRYFDVADRLVILEDGQVVRVEDRASMKEGAVPPKRLAAVTE